MTSLQELERELLALHGEDDPDVEAAARRLDADQRLVVYGSLAPGRTNHHRLESLSGTWHEGTITGELFEYGWGAALGYPALAWSPSGSRIPAWLLDSPDLPDEWSRLDRFEGEQYRRLPVPFHLPDGSWKVAQVYTGRR